MQPHLFHIDTALVSSRTVIRRFREHDGRALFELMQDHTSILDDHLPFLLAQTHTAEATEYFARRMFARWLLQKEFAFGIWEMESARSIGYATFCEFDAQAASARLNGFLHRGFTRKGIGTEVCRVLLRFAFEELKLERLSMLSYMDNYPAQRLVRKCGFHREGDLRSVIRKETGEIFDGMLLALTRQEYEKT